MPLFNLFHTGSFKVPAAGQGPPGLQFVSGVVADPH